VRGYAAIGLNQPKTPENIGSVLRAMHCFDATLLAISGKRFKRSATDTFKRWRHMPVIEAEDLLKVVPYSCVPVAVDLIPGAMDLREYRHPERAFYIFGPEDGTLGASVLSRCRDVVHVPTTGCLNLAATVNIVLYDRLYKTLPRVAP
jgi:tRNA(Leu) C34 or U34 (ribose-2'-O)-methylase TrmL